MIKRFIFIFGFIIYASFLVTEVKASASYMNDYSGTTPANTIPCRDQSGCNATFSCSNDASVSGGRTVCGGNSCYGGLAWQKYTVEQCYQNSYDSDRDLETCTRVWSLSSYIYSIGDKYNSSNTPVMNAGRCDLNTGGPYKTCCLGATPVSARNICSVGSPLCDPYDPPEADCGGNTEVRCGPGTPYACGEDACRSLAPPPTCDQSCTAWTNSECGNGSNGCSDGQRKQTRSCSLGSCQTSRCVSDSGCTQQRQCTFGVDTQICDTGWCPNGAVCAQGHRYCLWDESGYGPCSEEINNCSTQCAAPPPPPPGTCNFSGCGGNGCASDQRYVSGDKCYSDYSWYIGPGCYHDNSCTSGSSSSVSCTATTPVMRGAPTTISVTQQPNNGGEVSCYYNQIDANVSLNGSGKGSCAATGFNPDNRTRTCTYTPTEAGNYSVGVYYGGHSDPSYWDCWPTSVDPITGEWLSWECRWVQGCEDPQAWGNCNFTSIAMTPCPGGVNACGSSTYTGLSGCNGYWTYPNNVEYNRWCTATAGASRPNCYSCNAWGPPPTIISSTCTRSASLNTATLNWNSIAGANPYINAQSPVYGYYNLIYGTNCNPSNPATCTRKDNIYSTNETLENLDFGEYTWAVQGCNAVTRTCSGWSSPSGSFLCNVPAWIQTSGGDVHSNIRINAPGGP